MKQTIGATDLIDFPELALFDVQAKIDTGAFTSALHCKDVQVEKSDGRTTLSFLLIEKTGGDSRRFYVSQFSQRMIRNSFGVAENWFVIKTRVVLFNRSINAEFTLADREHLRNPVLLGRKLLRNRFVVDVSLANLSYDQKRTRSAKAISPKKKRRATRPNAASPN